MISINFSFIFIYINNRKADKAAHIPKIEKPFIYILTAYRSCNMPHEHLKQASLMRSFHPHTKRRLNWRPSLHRLVHTFL
jgi:hypothetical protein